MMGEYDAGYEHYIDSLIRETEKLQDENDKLREQVSSLVGRSFRTADKMSCIEADNAKLRESLEFANSECEKVSIEYLNLQAENAKLRELVRDMWREGMCECDERGACAQCEYHFPDRMRELGVVE